MESFPLILKEVFFTKLHIEVVPDHDPSTFSPEDLVQSNTIKVIRLEDKDGTPSNSYNVSMRVTYNPELDTRAPYGIEVECMALLVDNTSGKDPAVERGVHITGHSVVYGAIRESVLWMSSRLAYGPFTLGLSVLSSEKLPESNGAPPKAIEPKKD
jgi:hypothetical protein